MQVAFIHPRYPSAEGTGATHSATQIVSGLAEAGHELCVYCPELPDDPPAIDGVELRHLGGTSNVPHTDTRLNREVAARQAELREFDVVHSYKTSLLPSVAAVGDDADVATVVTLNAYGGVCAKNDLRYLDREPCREKSTTKCLGCIGRTSFAGDEHGYLYETAGRLFSLRLIGRGERRLDSIDGFQALSPHVREIYAGFGYEREKIRVIPNILDTQFDVEHETAFELPYRLLYVGSLQHSKGVDRLPEVLAQLSARTDAAVSLTVVGDGDLRTKIEQAVAERGLSGAVTFTGQIPYEELPGIYASHDLFLYPGRWDEPFGRVFIEAMATGTPVVSTDVGSVSEIIGDAGITTEQRIEALVDGLVSVLDSETLARHSVAGRERRHRYTSKKVIPAFERLYADVAGTGE